MYSMWKIMCFFNFKPHKHIALHQIHKIMFFLAMSYDPYKLQRVSAHTDFIKTNVRMITHRQETHTRIHTHTNPPQHVVQYDRHGEAIDNSSLSRTLLLHLNRNPGRYSQVRAQSKDGKGREF